MALTSSGIPDRGRFSQRASAALVRRSDIGRETGVRYAAPASLVKEGFTPGSCIRVAARQQGM